MTEIEKAKALWRICGNMAIPLSGSDRAQIANSFKAMIELAEQAEGFEAFKREVSDEIAKLGCWPDTVNLQRFILPKPVDPLVEAWLDAFPGNHREDSVEECEKIRAALAKRGLEVREIEG